MPFRPLTTKPITTPTSSNASGFRSLSSPTFVEPETKKKSATDRLASGLTTVFGSRSLGERIGSDIAKGKFGNTVQKAVVGKDLNPTEEALVDTGPTDSQVFGSALQSATLFAPLGRTAGALTAGARALGVKTGASAVGKIGAGALAGEAFDVGSNLEEGKTGVKALTPGLGTAIGGAIPGLGVAKNVTVRFGNAQAPRIINSLIKPLAKDFSYGKNPGRAIAESKIVANNFDDLITKIKGARQTTGQEIGALGRKLSTKPVVNIGDSLYPLNEAMKVAASQNNPTLLSRLANVKKAITSVLEPAVDEAGNVTIKEVGSRKLDGLTFSEARDVLTNIGDITQFTGNPSDDKIVNAALKNIYGEIKQATLEVADQLNPALAKDFRKLTEKYADLSSAEIAAKYRDKIVERSNLVGLSPQVAGVGTAVLTFVATGGAAGPALLAGLAGGVLDKLASTPAFKTRLAALLSKKSPQEVRALFRMAPALQKFFPKNSPISPGDRLLETKAGKSLVKGTKEYLKNPKLGASIEDVTKLPYKGETDLTTKILKDLEGKTTVSKQYILDATNRGELKQVERDLIRDIVEKEGDTINVSDFAKKVKAELLPLKIKKNYNANYPKSVSDSGVPIMSRTKFESISLPAEIRGKVKNYDEHLYESPIKTSAGSTHFPNEGIDNYFGHTRIEDMADNKTRRVIEVQSDLYQKGNLEREFGDASGNFEDRFYETFKKLQNEGKIKTEFLKLNSSERKIVADEANRIIKQNEGKLQQYNDPTAHFRMVREEIKKASQDGKTKLQFPTGETAMKIEGLGDANKRMWQDEKGAFLTDSSLSKEKTVRNIQTGEKWFITEKLPDGKFKALPDGMYESWLNSKQDISKLTPFEETFDISGKVDTNNPIYKFYEKDMQKYLTKFGGKRVVDDKGVEWIEVPVKKEWAKMPVEAFSALPFLVAADTNRKQPSKQ